MSVLAIIQARVGASRLRGKTLLDLCGEPVIAHVIRRVRAAEAVQDVMLAIPETPENDSLAAIGATEGVQVFRGPEDDVLTRYFRAAQLAPEAEVLVRITGEDVFKDPALIDYAVTGFLVEWAEPRADGTPSPHYLHLGGETWPLGCDVEVFTREALATAHRGAVTADDREHVTPWMRRELGVWVLKNGTPHPGRWTLDTHEDWAFVQEVYGKLYATDPLFGYEAMIKAGY